MEAPPNNPFTAMNTVRMEGGHRQPFCAVGIWLGEPAQNSGEDT